MGKREGITSQMADSIISTGATLWVRNGMGVGEVVQKTQVKLSYPTRPLPLCSHLSLSPFLQRPWSISVPSFSTQSEEIPKRGPRISHSVPSNRTQAVFHCLLACPSYRKGALYSEISPLVLPYFLFLATNS